MALTKNDLQSIQKIVKTEVTAAVKTEVPTAVKTEIATALTTVKKDISSIKSDLGSVKSELFKKIEEESSFVAGVCKRGFDEAEKKNGLAHKQLKSKIKDVRLLAQGIDRKLDAEVERHNNQDLKFKNHEERIIILEQKDKIRV